MADINVKWVMPALQALTAAAIITITFTVSAQPAYPSKPIRIISPYAPGGSVTAMARLVSQKLGESLGQQLIVDNRPGGNTVIGADALVKSAPDGYTIMAMALDHVIVPSLVSTPYDVIRDFAAVATLASSEYVLVVNPKVPADTLQEFIALAKSKPGQLNFGTSGNGSGIHIAAEFFNLLAGVKVQHIAYKGSGQALTDLMGGQVQMMFTSPVNGIPHIRSGRLKAIAYASEARSPVLPQVPTFAEAGLAGFEMKTWYGILAPALTPKEIINKLSTEIAKMLNMPDLKEQLASQGVDPFISTPDQFAALMRADMVKFAKVVKAANIRIEN